MTGLRPTDAIAAVGYHVLRQWCGISRYVAVVLHPQNIPASAFENPQGYEARFLSDAEVLRTSRDFPEFFSAEFAADALAKHNRCHGMFDRGRLVSCTWYAKQATRVTDDLVVHFSADYVYAYKSYTDAEYRGRRLHRLAGALALQGLAREGWKGLFAYADADNFSSRRSGERMGSRQCGSIFIFHLGRRRRMFHTAGCRRFGFRFCAE